MRRIPLFASLVLVAGLTLVAVPQTAGAACTPGPPVYDPSITSPAQAIQGFGNRAATSAELFAYLAEMDTQSQRVTTGTYATSVRGKPLGYALVSTSENMANLTAIVAANKALRDPRATSASEANALAHTTPAIVWYMANVHGNEPAPGDAALEILYDLAARTDCEAQTMLQNLVVGIIPTQNPDGRDANTRLNANGFDMNRDWFEQSQPETIGKIDLLTQYPGVLYMDAHEMFYSEFFFPPTADPTYHEISDTTMHWINDFYGPAMAAAFHARQHGDNFRFFNYNPYDFFAIVYGDTVPDTMFTGAGMTFEKGTQDQYSQRVLEHFVAGWSSIKAASDDRETILNELYGSYVTAIAEGTAGQLEPNSTQQPGNTVQRPVPDISVRSYFMGAARAYPEVARIVGRLMKAGVEVYRLDGPLAVPNAHVYGRGAASATLPAGTFWIPMNQPQKHWIQAMMGEDTYVPFPYFYDVTAWSNPLLGDVDAWWSGDVLSPSATRLTSVPSGGVGGSGAGYLWFPGDSEWAVAAALELARGGVPVTRLTTASSGGLPAGAFVVPASAASASAVSDVATKFLLNVTAASGTPPSGVAFTQPKIAVYSGGGESSSHLRFTLRQQWGVPFDLLSGLAINSGALTKGGYDVLVVPGVSTNYLTRAKKDIADWIASGGVYVGTARPGGTGGTPFAVASGFTSSSLSTPAGLGVPGTMFRVALNHQSPVTLGAPDFAYWYGLGEQLMAPSSTGVTAGTYPLTEPDFFVSGYASGADVLKGTAALVDEKLGAGRVILFSGEPDYRVYTDGTAFLLANAIAYPLSVAPAAIDVTSSAAASAVSAAVASAGPETGPGQALQIEVPTNQVKAALTAISAYTTDVTVKRARNSGFLTIPNPDGLDAEDNPLAFELLPALAAAGVEVRSAIL
jgi:hypothetical protein